MRAITVRQPWAWAIIHGGKDVENRTQAWSYRGPLAVHAGAQFSDRGLSSDLIQDAAVRVDRDRPVVVNTLGKIWRHEESLPLGAIIGIVDLVDIHHAENVGSDLDQLMGVSACCDSVWAERQYVEAGGRVRRQLVHLLLENPRPVDPIPCRGHLGLWTPPADVLEQLVTTEKENS
jgi:hypothetical protein